MTGTGGVLVAGGAGSRLALGIPKALARLGGATLLERGIATLAALCDQVVVTAPAPLAAALEPVIRGAGAAGAVPVRFTADASRGRRGPLAGVIVGLATTGGERAVVLGVDLPFVGPALLAALIERLGERAAVIPMPGGIPQPLAAAYAGHAGEALAHRFAAGERSLTRAVASLDALWLEDQVLSGLPGGRDSFLNLNTAADLAEAQRRLATREVHR